MLFSVLLRLSVDDVSEQFPPSAEIATVAEKEQFQCFRSNVARMVFISLGIEHLNVYMLKTGRRWCQ